MALPPSPTRIYEACLVEMGKTLRTAQFYPIQHPAFQRSLERSWLYLSQLLKRVGGLEITITKTAILVDDRQVTGNAQVLTFLAGECFRRRLKVVHVEPQAVQTDLEALFAVLSRDPKEIADGGGPEKALAKAGARFLWANAMRFDAQQLAAEREEPEPLDEQTIDEWMPEDTPDGHAELRTRLERLAPGPDPETTRRILGELVQLVRTALEVKDVSAALLATGVLARLADHPGTDPGRARAYEQAIRAIATPAVVEQMIQRMGRSLANAWEPWSATIRRVGPTSVPFLLSALAASESRKERLRILATVRGFGREARKPVLQLLQDARWYVLRNALDLLADVGGEELAPLALPFLEHEHYKVRQSAREALRRLGGVEAQTALFKATGTGSDADRRHAVSQLGFFPSAAVLPIVLDLIDHGPPPVAEEALRVLSELEPPDLMAFLEKVLRDRGGLLGRRRKDALRRAAAELICLRLPDTWGILKQFAEDPDPEIRKWVARGVEWLQRARRKEAVQS